LARRYAQDQREVLREFGKVSEKPRKARAMLWQTRTFYEFGPFRVDARERRLLRDGELVPLTPKVFEILLALVQNSGHVLSKGCSSLCLDALAPLCAVAIIPR